MKNVGALCITVITACILLLGCDSSSDPSDDQKDTTDTVDTNKNYFYGSVSGTPFPMAEPPQFIYDTLEQELYCLFRSTDSSAITLRILLPASLGVLPRTTIDQMKRYVHGGIPSLHDTLLFSRGEKELQIEITKFDPVAMTISGSLRSADLLPGTRFASIDSIIFVKAGVTIIPHPVNFSCDVDGSSWPPPTVPPKKIKQIVESELFQKSILLDCLRSSLGADPEAEEVGIFFIPTDAVVGIYQLTTLKKNVKNWASIRMPAKSGGGYENATTKDSIPGTLTITSWDATRRTMAGTFEFKAVSTKGSVYTISSGSFSEYHLMEY